MSDETPKPPCNKRVGKNTMTWACYLDEGHDGPCAARESAPSLAQRSRWEKEQEEAAQARAILAQGQGPAQTFAEARGEFEAQPHPDLREKPAAPVFPQARLDTEGHPVSEDTAIPEKQIEEITNNVCPGCGFGTDESSNVVLPMVEGGATARLCPNCQVMFTPSVFYKIIEPEPTKQREGDQPLPTPNGHPSIQDALIERIEARKQVGIERYGTTLQPFNGRNAILDAFEESLDLTTYLLQVLYENKTIAARLREVAVVIERAGFNDIAEDLRVFADTLDPRS